VICCRGSAKLDLVVAQISDGAGWFLQIAPTYLPGFFGRLLSRQASAPPESVLALAQEAYLILSERSSFGGFEWCWDGYPENGNSTPEPPPVPAA
jgi:hypothetical protein